MAATAQQALAVQQSLVRGLREALYARDDPSSDEPLLARLAAEESKLAELEEEATDAHVTESAAAAGAGTRGMTPPAGRFLGENTTGLRVEATLKMQPIPTAIYNLLDPEAEPLLVVNVATKSRDPRRVCVKAYIEGLSAQAVRTVEIDSRNPRVLNLLPMLLPERARAMNEVQRATLHVMAEDLDGHPECHDTYTVVCLSRNSSFNAVRRPMPGSNVLGEPVDLSHYYGAWVTPYDEEVQRVVREAAALRPDGQMWGYQGQEDQVRSQVGALYQALQARGITYINSATDYGTAAGMSTQRTRLPRESLDKKAANCMDGTVLFASLLEGASLNAALVLVPGHAFVAWESWYFTDRWSYLETTLLGKQPFDAACASAERQLELARKYNQPRVRVHKLGDLRARGIWPME
jgi:hypothetical protein